MSGTRHDDGFTNEQAWAETGAVRKRQPDPGPFDNGHFLVDWVDQHRETALPADPAYPQGVAIDVALDALKACNVELPSPAARCGLWVVTCRTCGFAISLATAGRADDPRTLRAPCRLH